MCTVDSSIADGLQDVYTFCGFALVLQLYIFVLFMVKASQYAHSTQDTVQRVINMLIAAVPTGAPTGAPCSSSKPLALRLYLVS